MSALFVLATDPFCKASLKMTLRVKNTGDVRSWECIRMRQLVPSRKKWEHCWTCSGQVQARHMCGIFPEKSGDINIQKLLVWTTFFVTASQRSCSWIFLLLLPGSFQLPDFAPHILPDSRHWAGWPGLGRVWLVWPRADGPSWSVMWVAGDCARAGRSNLFGQGHVWSNVSAFLQLFPCFSCRFHLVSLGFCRLSGIRGERRERSAAWIRRRAPGLYGSRVHRW